MKKLVFFLAVSLLFVSGLFAQKANDFIIYKSGRIVKCKILNVDSVDNNIKYQLSKSSPIRKVSMDKILAFHIYKSEANDGSNKINQGQTENTPNVGEIRLTDNQELDLAGCQLTKIANLEQTGTSLVIMGAVISVGSLLMNGKYGMSEVEKKSKENLRLTFTGIGLAVSAIGIIVQVVGYSNARNAGKLLQLNDRVSLNATQDGIGITMRIK
jgi:hypothetical protein